MFRSRYKTWDYAARAKKNSLLCVVDNTVALEYRSQNETIAPALLLINLVTFSTSRARCTLYVRNTQALNI